MLVYLSIINTVDPKIYTKSKTDDLNMGTRICFSLGVPTEETEKIAELSSTDPHRVERRGNLGVLGDWRGARRGGNGGEAGEEEEAGNADPW